MDSYEKAVACAARELIRATREDEKHRTPGTRLAASRSLTKLEWIVMAESNGWALTTYCLPSPPT